MLALNFSHPLTETNITELCTIVGIDSLEVRNIKVQLTLNDPFVPQVKAIVDSVGLTPTEWQTEQIIINLPGMSPATAILLAELHGKMGYFPTIMRLSSTQVAPPVFSVVEVIGLQNVRNEARKER